MYTCLFYVTRRERGEGLVGGTREKKKKREKKKERKKEKEIISQQECTREHFIKFNLFVHAFWNNKPGVTIYNGFSN